MRRRPAMGTPEEPVLLKPADVPADRHLGDVQLASQLADLDGLLLGDPLQDAATAVDSEHGGWHPSLRRACPDGRPHGRSPAGAILAPAVHQTLTLLTADIYSFLLYDMFDPVTLALPG